MHKGRRTQVSVVKSIITVGKPKPVKHNSYVTMGVSYSQLALYVHV